MATYAKRLTINWNARKVRRQIVRRVILIGVILQFTFFSIFACFFDVAKNCLHLYVISSLTSCLFFTYE